MAKTIIYWTLGLTLLYALLVLVVFTYQRRMLFPAPPVYLTPEAVGVSEMNEVNIQTELGRLTAWWSPPRVGCRTAVMVFHGNGSAVFSNVDIFRDLIDAGYGVWSAAYPGYPGSDGEASEASLVEAAILQYDLLRRNMGDDRLIYAYGTSMGSGVAAQLSVHRPIDRLFLDAPFYSIADLAKTNLWWLPVNRMLKDPFRSYDALAESNVPLIWTHGTKDTIVPIGEGQKLYDAYPGPKDFLIIEGGDHTNLWGLGGREFVMAAMAGATEGSENSPQCPRRSQTDP